MKDSQVRFGKEMIQSVAEEWGVTIEQAATILMSTKYRDFFHWKYSIEFLEEELWKP